MPSHQRFPACTGGPLQVIGQTRRASRQDSQPTTPPVETGASSVTVVQKSPSLSTNHVVATNWSSAKRSDPVEQADPVHAVQPQNIGSVTQLNTTYSAGQNLFFMRSAKSTFRQVPLAHQVCP
ncbi:unnamed protein product [Protopolystoma xenopodis]|uniref:Uncharacterized protein n=1 Tax=Protopolystoma xenopodis TaxID=117903 RepID=A0A448WID1_9PLAT|nr:unnamed protein product [Protopolystoma xenopodis]